MIFYLLSPEHILVFHDLVCPERREGRSGLGKVIHVCIDKLDDDVRGVKAGLVAFFVVRFGIGVLKRGCSSPWLVAKVEASLVEVNAPLPKVFVQAKDAAGRGVSVCSQHHLSG